MLTMKYQIVGFASMAKSADAFLSPWSSHWPFRSTAAFPPHSSLEGQCMACTLHCRIYFSVFWKLALNLFSVVTYSDKGKAVPGRWLSEKECFLRGLEFNFLHPCKKSQAECQCCVSGGLPEFPGLWPSCNSKPRFSERTYLLGNKMAFNLFIYVSLFI